MDFLRTALIHSRRPFCHGTSPEEAVSTSGKGDSLWNWTTWTVLLVGPRDLQLPHL